MPNVWRKVVPHPEGGAVKIANTLWPSQFLKPWIGKQVWVNYDDLNQDLCAYERERDGYITGPLEYSKTDAWRAHAEQERQQLIAEDPDEWED